MCLKCAKTRLAAGLHPDPLGELKRSPNPLVAMRGPTSKEKGKGWEGGEGRGGQGKEGGGGGRGN